MPSAIARLRDAVNDIQGWLATSPNPGEAVVRQAIVLRLLQAAGFDIWNPAAVVPEETNATGNRADFLIRAGAGKFALEIKGMGVTLGAVHFQQAATYAVNEGTRWALVTNGRVWIVIDEHLPGKWEKRVALRVELGQEGDTFAADLATLLDAETWRADAFAGAVAAVRQRQQQRLDEARIHKEKRPIVEAIQARYQIPTFDLAAENAVEAGKITEAERDVLLCKPGKQVASSPNAGQSPVTPAPELHFTYRILEAEARAIYRPGDGTWTVLAGSTALNRVLGQDGSNAQGIEKRRKQLREGGQLAVKSGTLLEYLQDVKYHSASTSAVDIAGASRNGWICWKDSEGHPAQEYRPTHQPD
ncbi:DUF4357 domain-containing protein [Deinococcus sp. MIMF12]|uniref:DUF4357 domain-containing protein n=1 Tax=Deinococcus rhizophilus TaxID=3049544 RepID=A0ABT7JCY8_9DEIO|nr:DUF4357 domain-containing protein [Deinococcus rhizophilus]MDL2342909.1 DUF4357 domain-containing protein [Deinococcus rhizophilus]